MPEITFLDQFLADPETGIGSGDPKPARCVQQVNDHSSAIHITYRSSLRSSSTPEPSDPLHNVLILWQFSVRLTDVVSKQSM